MTVPCGDMDPDLFFPPRERGHYEVAREVQLVCLDDCPATERCLVRQIEWEIGDDTPHDPSGIYGGVRERARPKVLKRVRDGELSIEAAAAELIAKASVSTPVRRERRRRVDSATEK